MEVDQVSAGASSAVGTDAALPKNLVIFMGMGRWEKDVEKGMVRAELERYAGGDSQVWCSPENLDLPGFSAEPGTSDQTRYFFRWRKYLSHVAGQFASSQAVIEPTQLVATAQRVRTWDATYQTVLSDRVTQEQCDIWKKEQPVNLRALKPRAFEIQDVRRGDFSGLFEKGPKRSIVRLTDGPEDLGYLLCFRSEDDVKALCSRRDQLNAAAEEEEAARDAVEAAEEEAGAGVEERLCDNPLTIEFESPGQDFEPTTVATAEEFKTFVQEWRVRGKKQQKNLFLVWCDKDRVDPPISVFDEQARCIKLLNVGGEGARAYNITVRFEEAPPKQEVGDASQNESDEWAQTEEDAGVYPAQVAVARRILERMRFILRCKDAGGGALSCDAGGGGFEFERLHFVVMLPNFVTLEHQTLARVKQLWRTADESVVFRYFGKGDTAGDEGGNVNNGAKKFKAFKKMVMSAEHAKTLFVMVDDECHCNLQAGSAHANWLNDTDLIRAPNLFQLLVSATPYNNLSTKSRVPHWTIAKEEGGALLRAEQGGGAGEELNVVEWFGRGKPRNDTGYFRFEDFLQSIWSDVKHGRVGLKDQAWSQLIRSDGALHSQMQQIPTETTSKGKHVTGSKGKHVLLLIADYVFSFAYMSVVRCISKDGGWEEIKDITTLTDVALDGSITVRVTEDDAALAKSLSEQYTECCKQICDDLRRRTTYKATNGEAKSLNEFMEAVFAVESDDADEAPGKVLDDEEKVQRLRAVIEAKLCDERRQFEEEQGAWEVPRKVWREPGQGFKSFSETDRIVRDLISVDPKTGTGRMKVIRVRSDKPPHGTGGCSQASWMKAAFTLCRKLFFKPNVLLQPNVQMQHFAVIVDAGDKPLGLNKTLEDSFYSRATCMCGDACEKPTLHTLQGARNERTRELLAKQLVGKPLKAQAKLIKEQQTFNFEDLQNIPCVLILVEKGRMGDTFPHSMNCLDLRIRASDNMMTHVQ